MCLLDDILDSELFELRKTLTALNDHITELEQQREPVLQQLEELSTLQIEKNTCGDTAPQSTVNYEENEFRWSKRLAKRLSSVFNLSTFRETQRGIINAALDGRDVVGIMPTGGGKSLCFQLPALLGKGTTLVVSPLLSLILDQISKLKAIGIEAAHYTGATTAAQLKRFNGQLLVMVHGGKVSQYYKLIFTTPETLVNNDSFTKLLKMVHSKGFLDRIVWDEVQCTFETYRQYPAAIRMLNNCCPGVPQTALSATLTLDDLRGVLRNLTLPPPVEGPLAPPNRTIIFRGSLYRPNIHFQVIRKPDSKPAQLKWLYEYIIPRRNQSGIIYCRTQARTERLAEDLRNRGIRAEPYHGGMKDGKKLFVYEQWKSERVKVICATKAFGLGIDKSNVRYVVHDTIAESMSAFFQESGRGGRDGADAESILLFRPQDFSNLARMVKTEGLPSLLQMAEFALNDATVCRNELFDRHFISVSSPQTDGCGHCDTCSLKSQCSGQVDLKVDAWRILRFVEYCQDQVHQDVTLAMLAKHVKGVLCKERVVVVSSSKRNKPRKNGVTLTFNADEICGGYVSLSLPDTERLILRMVIQGFLQTYIKTTSTPRKDEAYIILGRQAQSFLQFTSQRHIVRHQTTAFQSTLFKDDWPDPVMEQPKKQRDRMEDPQYLSIFGGPTLNEDDDEDTRRSAPKMHRLPDKILGSFSNLTRFARNQEFAAPPKAQGKRKRGQALSAQPRRAKKVASRTSVFTDWDDEYV